MRTTSLFILSALLLSACGTASSSTAGNSRASASSVYGKLLQVHLSGSWVVTDRSEQGDVLFSAPDVVDIRPDSPGVFRVNALGKDTCATMFVIAKARLAIDEQLTMKNMPRELPGNGGTDGYTWTEFSGTGSVARPTKRHWCLSEQIGEIELIALPADERTTSIIETSFIPTWRAMNRNTGK